VIFYLLARLKKRRAHILLIINPRKADLAACMN